MASADMTREERLQWCKNRALDYWRAGELGNAVTSMLSDLRTYDDYKHNDYLLALGVILVTNNDHDGVRRWIEGFR